MVLVERKIQVSNSELDVLKFIWRYEPVTCGLITHGMQNVIVGIPPEQKR